MSRYFCVECGKELNVLKNSVKLVKENDYIYSADLWGCKNCDFQIIITGDKPVCWHWEGLEKWLAFYADGRINYFVNID